eukprot:1159402-Pelagomonas_calceolata.AAC.11
MVGQMRYQIQVGPTGCLRHLDAEDKGRRKVRLMPAKELNMKGKTDSRSKKRPRAIKEGFPK